MSIADLKFTRTERTILAVLSDGMPHPRQQLIDCIPHGQGDRTNVNWFLHRIRQKLRKKRHDVICEWRSRQVYYRHVILLPPLDY